MVRGNLEGRDGQVNGDDNLASQVGARLQEQVHLTRVADRGKSSSGGDVTLKLPDAKHLPKEEVFIKDQERQNRQIYHLPADATSEQLFKAMAKSGFDNLSNPIYSPMMVNDALKELGIKKEGLTEQKFFDAFLAYHKRVSGVAADAGFEQLEAAMHKKLYSDIKHRKLPVDPD